MYSGYNRSPAGVLIILMIILIICLALASAAGQIPDLTPETSGSMDVMAVQPVEVQRIAQPAQGATDGSAGLLRVTLPEDTGRMLQETAIADQWIGTQQAFQRTQTAFSATQEAFTMMQAQAAATQASAETTKAAAVSMQAVAEERYAAAEATRAAGDRVQAEAAATQLAAQATRAIITTGLLEKQHAIAEEARQAENLQKVLLAVLIAVVGLTITMSVLAIGRMARRNMQLRLETARAEEKRLDQERRLAAYQVRRMQVKQIQQEVPKSTPANGGYQDKNMPKSTEELISTRRLPEAD